MPLIRLLGTVEIRDGDEWSSAGPPKQACVLAALTLARGRAVTGETLAHRVWGGDAPTSSRSVLYGHLARLRAALADHPEVTLHRATADGYRMTIPDDAVDVFLARRLAHEAAAAPTDIAVTLWRRAADLWRGPALGGIPGRWAHTVRSRLHSEHLELLCGLYEAEIAIGNASAVIAELEEHVLADPLAENLTARLMKALWTVGRPADALRRYTAARNALRDRLGREPGTELREIHRMVLAEEDEPTPIATTTIPAQLPADSTSFTGRATELDSLIHHVTDAIDTRAPGTVVVSAVDGMAGIGKTALVVRAANAIAKQFPDGQLFIDLHGFTANLDPVGPADALARLLRGMGVAPNDIPDNLDDRAAAFRTVLSGRKVLIVLDNAANEEQVRPLLPGASGCLVLITSRRTLVALDDVARISLEVLSTDDAIDMLLRASGRTNANREDARRLVDLCGRLPLAVRIAAARLRSRPRWSISDLFDRIGGEHVNLSELEAGERSVASAFRVSYQDLAGPQRRTFRLLGLIPGSTFTVEAIAALTAADDTRAVESLLEDLVDAHLIETDGRIYYRMHDLMRLYARHLVDLEADDDTRVTARNRLYWWYAASTVGILDSRRGLSRSPEPDPIEGVTPLVFTERSDHLAWVAGERTNLLAVLNALTEHGPTPILLYLAEELSQFYLDTGDAAMARMAAELGLWGAEQNDDLRGVARMHYELAQWYNAAGRQHDSIESCRNGLRAAIASDYRAVLISLHTTLAGSLYTMGLLEEADEHCRHAIEAHLDENEDTDAPRNILALVNDLRGHLFESLEQLHRVETSQRVHGRRYLHLVASNLAIVYTRLGNLAEAERYAVEGYELGEARAIRKFRSAHLGNLARLRLFQGRFDEAERHAADSIAAAIESSTRLQEPFCLNTIAMVHHRDTDRNIADAKAAVKNCRELEAHPEEVEALILLASALHAQGDSDAAERVAKEARDLAIERDYGVALAQALTVLALCAGDPDEGDTIAVDALNRHRRAGHRPGEIRALLVLASLTAEAGDVERARCLRADAATVQSECGIPPHIDMLRLSPL